MQKKILVLDDDLIITEILGQIVKNLGHYPVIAHNAPILASAKIKEFDAMLLVLWLSASSAEEFDRQITTTMASHFFILAVARIAASVANLR